MASGVLRFPVTQGDFYLALSSMYVTCFCERNGDIMHVRLYPFFCLGFIFGVFGSLILVYFTRCRSYT